MAEGRSERVDTEKITINLGAVDLGKVDVLVDEGFYGNRTDFIRTAIRNQLTKHEAEMTSTLTRKAMTIGAHHFDRRELEDCRAAGRKVAVSVVGLLSIATDVSPELAREVFASVKVRGVFRAEKAVKDALSDRTQ